MLNRVLQSLSLVLIFLKDLACGDTKNNSLNFEYCAGADLHQFVNTNTLT